MANLIQAFADTLNLTDTQVADTNIATGGLKELYGDREERDIPNKDTVKVKIEIGNKEIGQIILRSYRIDDGKDYLLPLYECKVIGKNEEEEKIEETFTCVRFGISKPTNNATPQVVGLRNAQSYILKWVDYNEGSWQVYDNFLIHAGPNDIEDSRYAAIGCIEICGETGWEDFNDLILELADCDSPEEVSEQKLVKVFYKPVIEYPPLIEVEKDE